MKIRCEACGTEYENATSMICDNCGYRMARTKPPDKDDHPEFVRCIKCGARVNWGVKICPNCGDLVRSSD